MNADRRRYARARLALRSVARQHLYNPNMQVTMIDYGIPIRSSGASDDPTLRFHVQKKRSMIELESIGAESIPRQIGEFTTDVIQGDFRPHFKPLSTVTPPATGRHDPLCCGISISDTMFGTAGTLGCLVRDQATGQEMILSNWHVLVVEWFARIGQPICQPGRVDGGGKKDVIATLTRHAMNVNIDAALATLTGARRMLNRQLDLGTLTGVARAELGMHVIKSGRTSGITQALVTGVDGEARIPYRGLMRSIQHVVTLNSINGGNVSSGGDSGSCWMEKESNRAIGLHFAGSNNPETGLALDMQQVLDALHVDLVVDHTMRVVSTQQQRVRQIEEQVVR